MAEREVKVKIGADTSGLKTGLNSANGMLAKFGGAAGIAKAAGAALGVTVGAVAAGMVALTRRSLEQIDAQAKLAQSLGTTVTSMQTLKRAGDLAGVSMGGIQQASSDLTRRLSQAAAGAGPVADALDRLNLSAAALSQVPLDERILQINEALDKFIPATERAAVAGQLFGEEGSLAMARIDTATLRQATEDVHRFGVVVSEQDADQIETANDAVSRLGLVMEGLGNRMATVAAPAIEATATAMVNLAARALGTKTTLEEFFGSLDRAKAILGDDVFSKMANDIGLIYDNSTQLEEITVVFDNISETAMDSSQSLRDYAMVLASIGEIGAADVVSRLADELDIVRAQFDANTISSEEFYARLDDIGIRAQSVVTDLEAVNGVGFSDVIGRLGAMAAALASTAAEAVRLRQALPGGSVGMTMAPEGGGLSSTSSDILPPSALAPTTSPRSKERPFELGVPDQPTNGGAGAGIKDMFAQRLEALQEGLQTEAETVQAWYDEGLTTLQTALERKMVTEEEYRALRERLEQEHNERLGRIRQIGNESAVSMALGAGEEILSAIGQTNQKALRIAKVFGAAQALISAYQGAAEALKLPFPKNIAAAAAVLAKGIGFVSAIKSVNAGGGSAGGGGGSSAAVAATGGGTTETRTANINFYGGFQPTQETIGMIASGLNDWLGDGGRLNMRTA